VDEERSKKERKLKHEARHVGLKVKHAIDERLAHSDFDSQMSSQVTVTVTVIMQVSTDEAQVFLVFV
jgi:hypothetical protein